MPLPYGGSWFGERSIFEDRNGRRSGMKQEEKKPLSWEVADPKVPVVQSGHLEGRKQSMG